MYKVLHIQSNIVMVFFFKMGPMILFKMGPFMSL